jgi:N-acetylneuraminic acid mutarotase
MYGLSIILITAAAPTGDVWETKTATIQQVGNLEAVAVGGKIFIFDIVSTYMYDPEADMLINKTAMPTPRTGFAIAAVGDKIYIIGGKGTNVTNVNEVYDTQTDTWETKTPFAYTVYTPSNVGACVVGDKIYVLVNLEIQQYDPATDSWTKITSISSNYMEPVSVNEKIYIINSHTGTIIYDTKTGNWTTGAPIPEYYAGAGVIATTGQYAPERIYVLGGYTGFVDSVVNATFVYDVASDTWSSAASMPTARCVFASAVLDDRIYCMGGAVGWFEYTQAIDVYTPLDYNFVQPSTSPGDSSNQIGRAHV